MKAILKSLHNDESGQGLVEYVLIVALISLAAVAAMGGLANAIKTAFNSASSTMTSATS